VQDSLGKSIDTSGLPELKGSVDYEKMKKAGITGGTNINTKMNLEGLQSLNDPTQVRQQAMDEAYKNFSSRFDPVAERQQDQMRTRIANMGGVTSSDASRQQMSDLLTDQNDARSQAVFDAQKAGQDAATAIEAQQLANRSQTFNERGEEMTTNNTAVIDALNQNNQAAQMDTSNAFTNNNLSNATRAQGLQELQQLRQMPLNELMAMLSGTQVVGGNFGQLQGSNTTAAPLFQGTQAQGAWDQNVYNQGVSSSNALVGALGSAAGGAAMM
jgi:hypothetical protein